MERKFKQPFCWQERSGVSVRLAYFNNTMTAAEFYREYKKLTGEYPDLLMPRIDGEAIMQIPRDPELIELPKKFRQERRPRFLRDNSKGRA